MEQTIPNPPQGPAGKKEKSPEEVARKRALSRATREVILAMSDNDQIFNQFVEENRRKANAEGKEEIPADMANMHDLTPEQRREIGRLTLRAAGLETIEDHESNNTALEIIDQAERSAPRYIVELEPEPALEAELPRPIETPKLARHIEVDSQNKELVIDNDWGHEERFSYEDYSSTVIVIGPDRETLGKGKILAYNEEDNTLSITARDIDGKYFSLPAVPLETFLNWQNIRFTEEEKKAFQLLAIKARIATSHTSEKLEKQSVHNNPTTTKAQQIAAIKERIAKSGKSV